MEDLVRIRIVRDGWYFILGPIILLGLVAVGFNTIGLNLTAFYILGAGICIAVFMIYFFRDPKRDIPEDPDLFVAGADGTIRAIDVLPSYQEHEGTVERISTFLRPFNVHVNRAPMTGVVKDLGYTPGKRLFTFQDAASEYNEHSTIMIAGEKSRCLVRQIVGPIVRRVVYWLKLEQEIKRGDRIGLMKFGSRLDIYFEKSDVNVLIKKGDKVRAGETVIATLRKEEKP